MLNLPEKMECVLTNNSRKNGYCNDNTSGEYTTNKIINRTIVSIMTVLVGFFSLHSCQPKSSKSTKHQQEQLKMKKTFANLPMQVEAESIFPILEFGPLYHFHLAIDRSIKDISFYFFTANISVIVRVATTTTKRHALPSHLPVLTSN